MGRSRKRIIKFHRKSENSMKTVKYLGALLAIALAIFLLPSSTMDTLALGGEVTGSGTDSTFWNGIVAPSNLRISQTVTVYEDKLPNSSEQQYTSCTNEPVEMILPHEQDQTFCPDILVDINGSYTEFSGDSWSYDGKTWCFDYLNCMNRGTITYYRITDGTSDNDMGEILLDYYKNNYSPGSSYQWSDEMMVTTQEAYGQVFVSTVSDCAAAEGWIEYYGDEISLWQGGSYVKAVEMLTVSPVDYWYCATCIDSYDSKAMDLDMMLYTTHTYHFTYKTRLDAPTVTTESGNALNSGISEDEGIILTHTLPGNVAKAQYYLSETVVTDFSQISWTDYTQAFSPGGMNYLYVRENCVNNSQPYVESAPVEYTITYLPNSSAIVMSTPKNGEIVDVGDEIALSCSGVQDEADLFYVADADSAPTLIRVSYEERTRLELDLKSANSNYLEWNDNVYIKINNIWYQSSNATMKKYSEAFSIGEQLRVKNLVTVYVLVGDSGKELGEFQPLRFSYGTRQQTTAPQPTVTTSASAPTTVKMGDVIGLVCSTSGSKIFYTTNGKAPIIRITEEGPVAGENTKEYSDEEPIVVNSTFANYGKSFLIMAQAVNYVKIGDSYYRVYQDSPIAKYTYNVNEQIAVEAVQAIPQTNADKPTEIQVGNRVQLYSETEGVEIYYTLDGSEPLFDESTGALGENTYKYSGATGITVNRDRDSSLFTITAIAYKPGLAVSDISRLVYAYPGAVSSPYANPASGAVEENTEVILKTASEKAVIYYEIAYGDKEPETPSATSKVFDERNPIRITRKTTVKAYAVKDSMESTVATFRYEVSTKLNIPKPSVGTGAVVTSGTVLNLAADEGATVHYTLDGSDPKDSENKKVLVGNKVVLNGDEGSMVILRAYASKTGYSSSDVGTYNYSISTYAGGIYADRESGSTVKNGDVINFHTDMSDAKIYYTTDGTTPTEKSPSGNAVVIDGKFGTQVTVIAMAVAGGSEKTTSFATFTYTLMNKLAAPTASVPDGAVFTKDGVVELTAETGRIYYTTDGREPSTSSNLYSKSIVIDKAVTIKAIAVDSNYQQSEISTFVYDFANQVAPPTANYASGELEMGARVTFTTESEDAIIYYRTDGVEPDPEQKEGLQVYTGPIEITKATNFKVMAVKEHFSNSRVLSVGYTVREPIVVETSAEERETITENGSGRLQSRRSFSDTEAGPSYTDIVLRNATYGVVVSGEDGSLQENAILRVENVQVTESAEHMVKSVLEDSYGLIASYNVQMIAEDEEIQPEQEIEIGIPIPAEYQNAIVQLVKVQEDGYMKVCNTRRSGGVAYVITKDMGNYSIAAPTEYKQDKKDTPWMLIGYCGAVAFLGAGCLLMKMAIKKKKEGEEQDV